MAFPAIIEGLKTKLGVSGKRKYDTNPPLVSPFNGMTLKEKLQYLVLHYRTIDRLQRLRRHVVYYQTALYYQGYQTLDLNPVTNTFDIIERDDYFVENQFRKHVDTVVNMLNKLEGEVLARPGSDSAADIACARVSDSVLSTMKDTIGYEQMRTVKNLYKCLFGNAFIFTDYVVDASYGTVVSPKYSYEEVPGPPDEFGMPTEPLLSKIATGMEKRFKGSEVGIVCSPLEINVRAEVKGGLKAVPYLQWITRHDIDTLNYIYPGLNITGGMSAVELELSQYYVEVLANLPGGILSDSPVYNRSAQYERAELVRSWLQPQTFRGDKELEREFPDGVHAVTVNGKIVDFYPELLTDRWTHEVLIPLPHSLLGDGLYDAIGPQDQINEMNSLFIKHLRYSTVGHKIYDATIIDPKEVVNDPANGWIPGRPTLEKNIGQAVKELPPSQLSQDVPNWLAHTHDVMQQMSSAFDPATGKAEGANSPYSQSVFLAEKAQGRWAGSMTYNKPELLRFNRQLLQIARDNWVDPRKRAFQKESGEWSFEQFTQADLQGQVELILTNGDMKPQSRAEQIQGLSALVQLAPIIPGLPPRQKLRVEEVFGLPPNANPASQQINRAYRHIDRLQKGEQYAPLPLVDDASIQVPVFQDFLASENGEQLAEENPQVFSAIYQFMATMMMIQQAQNATIGPQPHMPGGGAQPSPEIPRQGTPANGGPPKPPGGQPGQRGGGPGSLQQPNAQSPSQPAPPVVPPAS